MHFENSEVSSQRTVMSFKKGETKQSIHLRVPVEIHRDTLKRRGYFSKRDKDLASSRRLAIADSVDEQIYGNPPPPPPRQSHHHASLAIKTSDPSLDGSTTTRSLDGSATSLLSEMTMDLSTKTEEIDSSTGPLDGSARTDAARARSPKQKTRKVKKSLSDDSSIVSLLSINDDLTTISEKRRKKKNSSGRSVSSKSSKRSSTKKKKSKPSRKFSMQSVRSCESIDELTVSSEDMGFDGLTIGSSAIDDCDTADPQVCERSVSTLDEVGKRTQKKKKKKAPRRGSTGAISGTKKASRKSKANGNKGSVPIMIASGCSNDESNGEDTML